jgi:hypothetical protein
MYQIEELYLNRWAAYSVERALLTTRPLAALVHAYYQRECRLDEPQLNVSYRVRKESL